MFTQKNIKNLKITYLGNSFGFVLAKIEMTVEDYLSKTLISISGVKKLIGEEPGLTNFKAGDNITLFCDVKNTHLNNFDIYFKKSEIISNKFLERSY